MLKKWIALALSMVILLTVFPFDVLADPDPTTASQPSEATTELPSQEQTTPPADDVEEEETTESKLEALSPAQAAIPTHKLPTKSARIQRLRYYIQWDHQNALEQEGAESLAGYCGLLASYQMLYRGINIWRRCYDGKDYYDAYATAQMSDGGYTIRAYNALKNPPEPEEEEKTQEDVPATDDNITQEPVTEGVTQETQTQQVAPERYTIEQLLNQVTNNGTKEVYNILVCFDKTNTAAGSIYGHVVFVYGIIDGIVYYTEAGNGGKPFENTIGQFSAAYASWTELEGIIVFGNKDFMDNCAVYTSNMFVSCTDDVPLLTMPSQTENATVLRTAVKGERLQVIGLYHNRDQEYYYEIFDGDTVCYAPVQQLKSILFLQEPFVLEDPQLPQVLKLGEDYRLDGNIKTDNYMSRVIVSVLDQEGTVLQEYVAQVNESSFDLYNWNLNKEIDFGVLPEGLYTCRVVAESCNWYIFRGNLAKRPQKTVLAEQLFAVGETVEIPAPVEQKAVTTVQDGWVYENQTWYCYDKGTPLTGWQRSEGVSYYLQADGSVCTGWTLVEGQLKLFTATGALRTGWLDTKIGRKYLLRDGSDVHGWLQIDGTYYYFDELGIWQEDYMRNTLNRMAQLDTTPAADGQQTQTTLQDE